MPVGFCDDVDAGWAFVIGSSFGSVHVSSSSGYMVVRKFPDEDLGAVL